MISCTRCVAQGGIEIEGGPHWLGGRAVHLSSLRIFTELEGCSVRAPNLATFPAFLVPPRERQCGNVTDVRRIRHVLAGLWDRSLEVLNQDALPAKGELTSE